VSDPTVDDLKAQRDEAAAKLKALDKEHADKVAAVLEKHDAEGLLSELDALANTAPDANVGRPLIQARLHLRNCLRMAQAAIRRAG
jgi:hypothetical protein